MADRREMVPSETCGNCRSTVPAGVFCGNCGAGLLMRAALLAFTVLVGAIYLTLWVIDASRLTKVSQLALHIVMTALALLALRIGVQLALLHESTDPATGAPLLCSRCERVVPDMPFCPACGVAARAAPRASRTLRRESPPERIPSDHPQPSS